MNDDRSSQRARLRDALHAIKQHTGKGDLPVRFDQHCALAVAGWRVTVTFKSGRTVSTRNLQQHQCSAVSALCETYF